MLKFVAYFRPCCAELLNLDKKFNLHRLDLLSSSAVQGNSLSSLLLRMLACPGAACMEGQDIRANDVKYMRESLFSRVLSEAQLIHSSFGNVNIQIMVFIIC